MRCSGWWRSRFTPVHASWLDEAELLLDAFSYHYLKRGSWRESSRIHRLRGAILAGVQSAVCPSFRMDMVESEDEALGCGTWTLNFLHYFVQTHRIREQQFPPIAVFRSEKTLVLIRISQIARKMLLWTSHLNTWTDGVTRHGACSR